MKQHRSVAAVRDSDKKSPKIPAATSLFSPRLHVPSSNGLALPEIRGAAGEQRGPAQERAGNGQGALAGSGVVGGDLGPIRSWRLGVWELCWNPFSAEGRGCEGEREWVDGGWRVDGGGWEKEGLGSGDGGRVKRRVFRMSEMSGSGGARCLDGRRFRR